MFPLFPKLPDTALSIVPFILLTFTKTQPTPSATVYRTPTVSQTPRSGLQGPVYRC